MIYLFHGSDSEKARRQAFAFVEAARKKQPGLAYLRLAREDLSKGALEEAASAGGLFVSRLLVLLDDPFPAARKADDEDDAGESVSIVEDYLDALADSDNAIVILAPKLHAAKAKRLAAKAEKEYKFDKGALREDARGFNGALVNALGTKDGKKLWLEVARALAAGDAPEQVHGLLHWKARDILERGSRIWKEDEAQALSLALIELVMRARRAGLDLGESLERFALAL